MNKTTLIVPLLLFWLPLGAAAHATQAAQDAFGDLGLKGAQLEQGTDNHLGSLVVLDVRDDTPASASGIQRGAVISRIDGDATKGPTFERLILKRLRGKAGSKASHSVERSGYGKSLSFSLARIEITPRPER